MEKESKRQRKLELDRATGVKGRNREKDKRVGPSLAIQEGGRAQRKEAVLGNGDLCALPFRRGMRQPRP